jgi:peptidase A4-like protein
MVGNRGRLRVHAMSVAGMTALALLTLGLGAGATQAADAPPAHLAPMESIPNWSGYVATHQPGKKVVYKSVTGTWTVPTATCSKKQGPSSSAAWVGIGGYKTTNQEEVGTNSNCSKKGKPVYFAWFELVPYLSYQTFPNISHKVAAGDTITGLVRILNYRFVRLEVKDVTRGWDFVKTINFSSQDTTTADWVMEAPATCVLYTCQEASLTNFGSITMRNISAVGNGATGTLADPKWKVIPIRLVPTKLTIPDIDPTATATDHNGKKGEATSPAGATPTKYSSDGTSFGIKWIPQARQGV